MAKLVSLVRHPVTLRDAEGVDHVVEPSGFVALVNTTRGTPEVINGVPVPVMGRDMFAALTGFPEAPEEGAIYIVSFPVGQALAQEKEHPFAGCSVTLGTGPHDGCVRNDAGHVVAVTRLKRV